MNPNVRTDVFGWFDGRAETPSHDPGFSGTCPVCGKKLERPVKTISLMPADIGSDRSYFFRAHKECWDGLPEDEQCSIESSLIDELCDGKEAK